LLLFLLLHGQLLHFLSLHSFLCACILAIVSCHCLVLLLFLLFLLLLFILLKDFAFFIY
jgi:hypothetical protein